MKKLLLSIVLSTIISFAFAAPFKFLPHKIIQPDGTIIECFLSGDEFFNWIHDKDGYSIIKGKDGYYYYATKAKGKIVASDYKVNEVDPNEVALKKWTVISKEEYLKKRELFNAPLKNGLSNAPHTGVLNNLVIYIRFSGEAEISTTRQEYDDKLNPETGNTLKSYYKEVSYNQLTITSTHYPDCASPTTTNASYEDSHTRSYFQPYDATTNPDGYDGDSERTSREHQLLVDAINWVNTNYPVDGSLDIDGDDDGYVDNVCFMIQGNSDGWNDLLWAHRWALYSQAVYINSKRVYDYTFQPENQVSVRTLCHEMFHALGAPDLYHYYNGTSLAPVSSWDIMEQGGGHMGAYMKYKYADQNWISDIPEITTSGTYILDPLTSSTNNCYKIASPNSTSEFFVVEYRLKGGEFESNLPGNGLLVYRINDNFNGNAQYDGSSVFDEVYIYRPGGTTTTNGSPNSAHFSADVSRTEINDQTNPSSFLSDGSEGNLNIYNVTTAGATISFDVKLGYVTNPVNFTAISPGTDQIDLSWALNGESDSILLAYSTDGTFGTPIDGTEYSVNETVTGGGEILYIGKNTNFSHQSLVAGQTYYYKLWSVNSDFEYSTGIKITAFVDCEEKLLPFSEDFSDGTLPSCWMNNDAIGEDQAWEFDNPGSRTFNSTTSSNGFAILDSDNYGSGYTQNASLISPLLDLSTYESVNLTFEHYFELWSDEMAELAYSVDGGQNWTVLQTWTTDIGSSSSPSVYNNDISSYVAGEARVKIRWRYEGSYGYYWMIDDISITGTNSGNPVVKTENSDGIGLDLATLHGTINANDNSITEIKFEYGTETGNYTNTINASPNSASGTSNTAVSAGITGLTINTEYFYRVTCKNGATTLYGEEKSFITEARPTVTISSSESDYTNVNPFDLTFSFSEAISSLSANNITVTNATVNSISIAGSNIYTVGFTPASDGEVTVQVTENSVEDLAGYGNFASDVFSVEFDGTLPTVNITSSESTSTSVSPIPLTFTFSEDIKGFELTDITVTNGTAGNFSNSGNNIYAAEITPNITASKIPQANNSTITVLVNADAVVDSAGNNNAVSDTWTINYTVPSGIEQLNEMGIKLFPNPTNGLLTVEFNKSYVTGEIKVFDQSGRIVYNQLVNHVAEQKVDLTNQAKGIYFIVFLIDNKQISTELIIQ